MVISERLQQKRLASAAGLTTTSPYFSSNTSTPNSTSNSTLNSTSTLASPNVTQTVKRGRFRPGSQNKESYSSSSSSSEPSSTSGSSKIFTETKNNVNTESDTASTSTSSSTGASTSNTNPVIKTEIKTEPSTSKAKKGKAPIKIEYENNDNNDDDDDDDDNDNDKNNNDETSLESKVHDELVKEVKMDPSIGSKIPDNFLQHLHNIREMRKNRDAPVDVSGCERLASRDAEPKVYRYQVLLSLMLSAQTRDEITAKAMKNLIEHGCTVENILSTPLKKLQELIYPVSFYGRKAEYILATTQILRDKYKSDIPPTLDELMELRGVGPKMAHLVMTVAWGKVVGIGVDTHVHRISNRLKWVKKETKTPEDTRKALQDWLPREYWTEINWLLVGFGQQICKPVNPRCWDCLNINICPFAKKPENRARIKKELIKQENNGESSSDIKLEQPEEKKSVIQVKKESQ